MATVNVHAAKTHLSRLIDRAAKGEEIVIARAGKPIARLTALAPAQRRPGQLRGKIRVLGDFDAPLPPLVLASFQEPLRVADIARGGRKPRRTPSRKR